MPQEEIKHKLLLASLGSGDQEKIQEQIVKLQKYEEDGTRLWNKNLFGYLSFGMSDMAFIAKSDDAWEQLVDLFGKINLKPGEQGTDKGGWSRIYVCDLHPACFSDDAKKCYPFGYLILAHDPLYKEKRDEYVCDFTFRMDTFQDILGEDKNDENCTMEAPCPVDGLSAWKTEGYYKWCFIRKGLDDAHLICRDLHEKGLQTYTIPLASLIWVTDPEAEHLQEDKGKKAKICVEVNTHPGEHIAAAQTMCHVFKESVPDKDTYECSVEDFQIANGIKEVYLNTVIEVYLDEYIQSLWKIRQDSDIFLASRTYLIESHPDIVTEDGTPVEKCDCECCGVPQRKTAINLHRQKGPHPEQIQPIRPFNVYDLADGYDWSSRMFEIRREVCDIFNQAYKNLMGIAEENADIDESKAANNIFPELDLNFDIYVKSGSDIANVMPVIGPKEEPHAKDKKEDDKQNKKKELNVNIRFSGFELSSKYWHEIAIHEMVQGTTYGLFQIVHKFAKNVNLPMKWSSPREGLFKFFWKHIGESLGTAIIMEKKDLSPSTFLDFLMGRLSDIDSKLRPEEEKSFKRYYITRLIVARFIQNRLKMSKEGDTPNPHWIVEMHDAHQEITKELGQPVTQSMRSFLIGILDYREIDAPSKNNIAHALNMCWFNAIQFGRQLTDLFGINAGDLTESTVIEEGHWEEPDFFFRTLMIESLHDFQDYFQDSVLKGSGNLTEQANYAAYLKAFEEEVDYRQEKLQNRVVYTPQLRWRNSTELDLWSEVDYDLMINTALIYKQVRAERKLLSDGSKAVLYLNPESKHSRFISLQNKEENISGYEILAGFAKSDQKTNFPVMTQETGDKENISYGLFYKSYVEQEYSLNHDTYNPVQIALCLHLEMACLHTHTASLDEIDIAKDQIISFNLPPWVFDPKQNPWMAGFGEEYIKLAQNFCESVIDLGGIPVVEIIEGDIPDHDKGLWEFLRKLKNQTCRKNPKARIGVAVDDQFGPGTDMERLREIINRIGKAARYTELKPFLVKVDHKALFSLLKLEDVQAVGELEKLKYYDIYTLLGNLACFTAGDLDDVYIVFEGYDGDYKWKDKMGLKKKHQDLVQEAINEINVKGANFLQVGKLLLQGE